MQLFIGQLMGTAAGTEVFTTYGWRPAAALNLGFYVWILGIIMLRGPHCARFTWFGYEGGWEPRKSVVEARKKAAEEATSETGGTGTTTPQGGDLEKGAVGARSEAGLEQKGAAGVRDSSGSREEK